MIFQLKLVIFHSYVNVYQRVNYQGVTPNLNPTMWTDEETPSGSQGCFSLGGYHFSSHKNHKNWENHHKKNQPGFMNSGLTLQNHLLLANYKTSVVIFPSFRMTGFAAYPAWRVNLSAHFNNFNSEMCGNAAMTSVHLSTWSPTWRCNSQCHFWIVVE